MTAIDFKVLAREDRARMAPTRGARGQETPDRAVIVLGLACAVALLRGAVGGSEYDG